jgi:hypothetical protein
MFTSTKRIGTRPTTGPGSLWLTLAALIAAATLASVVEAQTPRRSATTVNVTITGPKFPKPQPFYFRSWNPWVAEATRERQILFNRSAGLNQPISRFSTIGPLSATPRWPIGVNPFLPAYPGGPTVPQLAYNTAMVGAALQSYPPWVFSANPGLYGGSPYNPSLTGYPYDDYGSGSGGPYGGYFSGGSGYGYYDPYSPSTQLDAGGRYLVNVERSRLTREQVRQAKVDTRRRAFDEYLFERKNAPTWEDNRERLLDLSRRHALNEPPVTEIWSGRALNELLADVQLLQAGKRGDTAPIAVDESLMKRVNVTAGMEHGNIGLLKDGGKLPWPEGLRRVKPQERVDRARRTINSLLPEAIREATESRSDPEAVRALGQAVAELQKLVLDNAADMPPEAYMETKRFLNRLEDGVRLLRLPDASSYFNEKYAAQGKTVQEVVDYMSRTGLFFAPSVGGDESAYVALHRALVAYDLALRGGAVLTQER